MQLPADSVRLRVLGHVELIRGSAPLPLSQLERALLAKVALCPDGTSVAADTLVPWIWGDGPPASGRNRVQALVSGLRRKMGDQPLIETTKCGYRLAETVSSDWRQWQELIEGSGEDPERWQHLSSALELFAGSPLQGIPATQDVDLAQETLAGERLAALEECNELAIQLGELRGLATRLSALVQDQPFHEAFAGQLMRVLAGNGRQEEALRVYREIYQRLDDELGVAPSEVLCAAHQEVLRGVRVAQPDDSTPAEHDGSEQPGVEADGADGAPESPLPVPRTLPRAPSRLFGREAETRLVIQAVERAADDAVVVSVTGLTGVGKSALAIRAVRDIQEQFPDGTLYADLGNMDTIEVSGVLGAFLRLLGIRTRAIPEDLAARVGLFRSVLEDRRVAIVLDNAPVITARTAAALEQLLPVSAGSLAVVTSRGIGVDATDWSPIPLLSLSIGDARDLLGSLIGTARVADDPDGADALLHATGRLPLAIRLVAGRLTQRPDLTFEAMADRLLAGSRGSDALSGLWESIDLVWERCTPQEQRAIALVAHLPVGGVSGWMPGVLLGDENAGDRLIETLLGTHLVEPVERDDECTIYRLHDLVAQYARANHPIDALDVRRASVGLGRELLRRACSHHGSFQRRFVPVPPPMPGDELDPVPTPSPRVARSFFRADGRAMLAVAEAVAADRPDLAWRLVVAAANAQHTFIGNGSWLQVAARVRTATAGPSADQQLGQALLQLAEAWHRHDLRSQSKQALADAAAARKALTLLGAREGAAAADLVCAQAALAMGRRRIVEESLARAEAVLGTSGDPTYAGWAAMVRGTMHGDYDELDEAQHELVRCREVLTGHGDHIAYALATIELARVNWRQHQLGSVNVLLTEVVGMLGALDEQHLLSYALDAHSEMSFQLGREEEALAEAESVCRRAEGSQDVFLAARAQRTRARVLASLGRLEEAETQLRASIEECTALDRPLSVAAAMHDLAIVLTKRGQHAAAGELQRQERAARASADLAAPETFANVFGRELDGTGPAAP